MRRGFVDAQPGRLRRLHRSAGPAGQGRGRARPGRAGPRPRVSGSAGRTGRRRPAGDAGVRRRRTSARRHAYHSTILAYWVGPSAVSIWVVRPDREPVLVRVPVLPSKVIELVRATAGLDGDGGAARGLLMTDRAQQAPWRELEATADRAGSPPAAAGAREPPDDRAARPAVRAVLRRAARTRRSGPPRGARPALPAGDRGRHRSERRRAIRRPAPSSSATRASCRRRPARSGCRPSRGPAVKRRPCAGRSARRRRC